MKKKEKVNYPPFMTMDEFESHTRKMNFFFIVTASYSLGIFIGYYIDIFVRYG